MRTTYIVAGVICLIVAAGAAVYIIQSKPKPETEQNQSQNQSSQTADSKPAQNDDEPTKPTFSHGFKKEKIEGIAAVFSTMNTEPMLGYFAGEVTLVYGSPDRSAFVNRERAPKTLEYFEDAQKPWDFFLSQADIDAYKSESAVAKYFEPNCLVGRSANGAHVVSLCTDKDGKIDTVFMRR